jgi:hypothetical protein
MFPLTFPWMFPRMPALLPMSLVLPMLPILLVLPVAPNGAQNM